MIQDILPHHLNNAYQFLSPSESDRILVFRDKKLAVAYESESQRLIFPSRALFPESSEFVYLFSCLLNHTVDAIA